MLKVLCQNHKCSYPKYLLPQTTYAHLEYFINIYIFVVSYLFVYAHWRAKLMSCTHLHLFEKKLSCHLSTLERQLHIIYSFGKHSRAIFDMGTFFERLLMLHIHKYTYFLKCIYLLPILHIQILKCIICYTFTLCKVFLCYIFTHFARHLHAIYIHTYIHIIERYFPCYLGARYSSWGSQI